MVRCGRVRPGAVRCGRLLVRPRNLPIGPQQMSAFSGPHKLPVDGPQVRILPIALHSGPWLQRPLAIADRNEP